MISLTRTFASTTVLALSLTLALATTSGAQDVPAGPAPGSAPSPSPSAARAAAGEPDDLEPNDVEPDFTVINLPTTARLPRHKSAFRVTHRFARPLGEGDFGDLAADAFGFDGGAQIGLEYRFGVAPGTQLGFYRTSDRTIEFFGQYDLWQPAAHPVGLAVVASVEGLDNFQEQHQPRVGIVVSLPIGDRVVAYAVPAFIANTNIGVGGGADEDKDSTLLVGLGARLRFSETGSLLAEITPRVAGFKGGPNSSTHATFALEKRVGGHAFQINFSNDLGTTPGQIARGQQGADGWFLGFNISRKFY